MSLDKLQALQALLGEHTGLGLSDDDSNYWRGRWAEIEQAASKQAGTTAGGKPRAAVSLSAVAAVLWVLTISANNGSLRTDQSLGQLMGKTKLGEGTVKRVLALLDALDLVPALIRGGGPPNRKQGKDKPQATVRWLKFAAEYRRRTQATEAITQTTNAITQATSGPHYNSPTTNHQPAAQVAVETQAANGSSCGVEGKAKQARAGDLWAHQLAKAAVADWLTQQGLEGANNPEAVLRSRHDKAAEAVEQLVAHEPRLREITPAMPYDWHELVTWVVCVCRDQEPSGYLITNVRKALEHLRNEQQPRPAVL